MKTRKYRSSDTCKKVNCVRYEAYKKWELGKGSLDHCMNCKWAHVSQFENKGKP